MKSSDSDEEFSVKDSIFACLLAGVIAAAFLLVAGLLSLKLSNFPLRETRDFVAATVAIFLVAATIASLELRASNRRYAQAMRSFHAQTDSPPVGVKCAGFGWSTSPTRQSSSKRAIRRDERRARFEAVLALKRQHKGGLGRRQ